MNIFYLDKDPVKSAEYHCDKHVVKMILELAQLLSTAHRVLQGELYIDASSGRKIKRWKLRSNLETVLYKATHINHPSAVWVRESAEHYRYTYELFRALCKEYTYRYGKVHATEVKLLHVLKDTPEDIPEVSFIEPPQAMPEYCRVRGDSVQAYRKYYLTEKRSMLQYKIRNKPDWFKGI
jgi:CHAD domain-containing protein